MALLPTTKRISLIIETDINDSEEIKKKIGVLNEKVQRMLLWSNLSAIWGYLLLASVIVKVYEQFKGPHPLVLITTLGLLCAFWGIYLFIIWKGLAYNKTCIINASKAYLNYQIKKSKGQRKLITAYLIGNTLLLGTVSIFFGFDISNGLPAVLKMVVPVSIFSYILGLYFILKFSKQQRHLELMNRQIDKVILNEKVSQN